ncbi:hypothetical protein [Leifsonia poae]|uniref:hypothetical protein n=1 Tax=Leifsonia poae TaxID=110933 RepID=UPI001CBCFD57|nr:hypothetical protein [Leifsonia poae]
MSTIAVNLEWLFTEAGEGTAARIRAAAAHGVGGVATAASLAQVERLAAEAPVGR